MVKIAIPNFCINFLNKTVKSLSILCDFAVTSLADAWIKINGTQAFVRAVSSHPLRMRGLKCRIYHTISVTIIDVAPLTGAWIKIGCWMNYKIHVTSHPSRVRGLKYFRQDYAGRIPRGCVD